MTRFVDWKDAGIFVLQDHVPGIATGRRMQMAGMRLVKMSDADEVGGEPTQSMAEFGVEDGIGTIGDIHPWMYWGPRTRATRDTGTWSQIVAGITVKKQTGAGPITGPPQAEQGTSTLPIGFIDYKSDTRFVTKNPAWPSSFPTLPKGHLVLVAPAMDETQQALLQFTADPRMYAPAVSGPASCGSIIQDLQPDNSPSFQRGARLQSLVRVVVQGGAIPGATSNVLAINYTLSEQGGHAGMGAVWGRMDAGAVGPITGGQAPVIPGPTTGGPTGPITGQPGGSPGPLPGSGGPGAPPAPTPQGLATPRSPDGFGVLVGVIDGAKKGPKDWEKFEPKPADGKGCALMAQEMSGPIHLGHAADKHQIGRDVDGNPINAAHCHEFTYFYRNQRYDGPLLFEGDYPYPPGFPLKSPVHLSWDRVPKHPFVMGPQAGFWRWWAEVPFAGGGGGGNPDPRTPPSTPRGPTTPSGPGTPSGPTTGGPSGPTTGGPGGGGGGGGSTGGGSGGTPSGAGATTPNPWTPGVGPRFPGYPLTGVPSGPYLPHPPLGPSGGGGGAPSETGPSGPTTGVPTGPYLPPGTEPTSDPSGERPRPLPTDWDWPYPGPDFWRRPNPSFRPLPQAPSSSGGVKSFSDDGLEYDGDGNVKVGGNDGVVETVGKTQPGDVGNYQIMHPIAENFAALGFRPQLWVEGYPSFEHNPDMPGGIFVADEAVRPQVVVARAWAAQSAGDWLYTQRPETSRARGGIAAGGVLFSPPEFEMEDYLLSTSMNVRAPSTTSYVTMAPGVSIALGTPTTSGTVASKTVTVKQSMATSDEPVVVSQFRGSTETELWRASVDQGTGVVTCAFQGSPTASSAATTGNQLIRYTEYASDLLTLQAGIITLLAGKQDLDAELTAIAGLTSAADRLPYFTGSGTASLATFTSTARNLLDDTSTSAMRTTLGLVIGTDVQGYHDDLQAIADAGPGDGDILTYATRGGWTALANPGSPGGGNTWVLTHDGTSPAWMEFPLP